MGDMYIEMDGEFEGLNETTGDSFKLKLTQKSKRNPGTISGTCKDKNGKVQWTVSGIQGE